MSTDFPGAIARNILRQYPTQCEAALDIWRPTRLCHCGDPGEKFPGKLGILCDPCAYAAHETCYCSKP